MRVTSLFRRNLLKDERFADAHPLSGVTFHDCEVMSNMFFVLAFLIVVSKIANEETGSALHMYAFSHIIKG